MGWTFPVDSSCSELQLLDGQLEGSLLMAVMPADLAMRAAAKAPLKARLTAALRCGELVLDARENRMESAGTVSMRAEVPEPLLQSMQGFIEAHPNWDQYRLFQAALAGFLVQNGVQTREITRCYLANLFPQQSRFSEPLV